MVGLEEEAHPLAAALGGTPGLVVRRTFIEFVAAAEGGAAPHEGLRRRAGSDPGLADSGGDPGERPLRQAEEGGATEAAGQVDFELDGLSDSDPGGEGGTRWGGSSTPRCARASEDHLASGVPRGATPSTAPSEHSSDGDRRLPAPAAVTPLPVGPCGDQARGDCALERLVSENRRLAEENRLLRENTRLLLENRLLAQGILPESVTAQKDCFSPGSFNLDEVMITDAQIAECRAGKPGLVGPTTAGGPQAPPRLQQALQGVANSEVERTTVMLRNLPNNYSRAMVLAMLNDEGFGCLFDFLYLPIDFKSRACLGYAFVNLVSPEAALALWKRFDGFSNWMLPSRKVCSVCWSGPHQGLEAHIERYRNSPVMHASIPDEYKPVVFADGVRIVFPPPTKAPRAPRIRNQKDLRVS